MQPVAIIFGCSEPPLGVAKDSHFSFMIPIRWREHYLFMLHNSNRTSLDTQLFVRADTTGR